MMKRLVNIFVAAALVLGLAASCEKAPSLTEGIVAEWQLTEMTGYAPSDLPGVYIEFTADLNFVIYQKIGNVTRYRKYVGAYLIEGSTLSGIYSDGEDWGSSYRAEFEADGDVLVMTAFTTGKDGSVTEGEVLKYVKASLSQEEKDAADIVTKSQDSVRFL
jgi:hypothetical protein